MADEAVQAAAELSAQGILDDIWNTLVSLYNTITTSLSDAISSLQGTLSSIWSYLKNQLATSISSISSAVYSTYNTLYRTLTSGISSLGSQITSLGSSVVTGIANAVNILISPINNISNTISSWVGRLYNSVSDLVSTIRSTLANAISGLGSVISSAVAWIGTTLRDAVNGLGSTLARWMRQLGNWLADASNAIGRFLADLSNAIGQRLASMAQSIGNTLNSVSQSIGNALSGAAGAIGKTLASVATTISTALNKLLGEIIALLNALIQRMEQAVQGLVDWVNRTIFAPLQKAEGDTRDIIQMKAGAVMRLALGGYHDPRDFLHDLSDPPPLLAPIAIAIGSFIAMIVLAPAASHALEPLFAHVTNTARAIVGGTLLTPEQIAQAYFRNLVNQQWVLDELAMWGYTHDRKMTLIESARPLPSPGAIQALYLRGLISEGEHDQLLGYHGYSKEHIAQIKALYDMIPPVSDIIRMAVREAFSPEVAQKFGQYEDFPQEVAVWAKKQGLSEEWAKRYWAAHWELPSAQMGYEMLHRGIISEDELKLLLRALDVMPFWREKLIKMSYAPYTRVDVRRMYQLGVLSKEDVIRAYRDLGYDEEKARHLTEFTVRYYASETEEELEEVRQLSRTVYVQAYQRGIITRNEALARIADLGYAAEDAELLLKLADAQRGIGATADDPGALASRFVTIALNAYQRGVIGKEEFRAVLAEVGKTETEINWYSALGDYERAVALHQKVLGVIAEEYQTRVITRAEAQAKLASIGATPGEIERLLREWDIMREERTRHPTEAQLRAALYAGLITVDQYAEELRGLGYAEKYVAMLKELALKKMG